MRSPYMRLLSGRWSNDFEHTSFRPLTDGRGGELECKPSEDEELLSQYRAEQVRKLLWPRQVLRLISGALVEADGFSAHTTMLEVIV